MLKLIPKYKIGKKISFYRKGKSVKRGSARRGVYTDRNAFVKDLYNTFYTNLLNSGVDKGRAQMMSQWIVGHKVMECGYGQHLANHYNYGGIKSGSGWASFNSMDDYAKYYIDLLKRKYPGTFTANSYREYSDALFTDSYGYDPKRNAKKVYDKTLSQNEYFKKIDGTRNRVSGILGVSSDWTYRNTPSVSSSQTLPQLKPQPLQNDNTRMQQKNVQLP